MSGRLLEDFGLLRHPKVTEMLVTGQLTSIWALAYLIIEQSSGWTHMRPVLLTWDFGSLINLA